MKKISFLLLLMSIFPMVTGCGSSTIDQSITSSDPAVTQKAGGTAIAPINWKLVAGKANQTKPLIISVQAVAISPAFATDHTVFVGTSVYSQEQGSVFKSMNGGSSWSEATSGMGRSDISSIAVSPNFASDQTLFSATGNGVFRSTDGGSSWSAASNGISGKWIGAIVVSSNYASDQILFAGGDDGVFKSMDSGSS